MARILVIAYGNPLRTDDGVALHVADTLEKKFTAAEVEVLRLHQLGPELAESVSRVRCVIFVDAAAGSAEQAGEIKIQELSSSSPEASKSASFCHALPPSAIMGLAARLYGATPRAVTATVSASSFEHGESLSCAVAAAVPLLVTRLEELIRRELNADSPSTPKDTK